MLRDRNDRSASQGVYRTDFLDVTPGSAVDKVNEAIPDSPFAVNGANVRRVEPRNTPTVFNAVFNHRNFWDGRANFFFNGSNPLGSPGLADPLAKIVRVTGGIPVPESPNIPFSSLASQASGPPVSPFEMSAAGAQLEEDRKEDAEPDATRFAERSPWVRPAVGSLGLVFIAAQSCLAYAASGVAKLVSPVWISGEALPKILATVAYGSEIAFRFTQVSPRLTNIACRLTVVMESAFPLVLIAPTPAVYAFIIFGAVFHILNAFIMGLNTFLWSFLATYPAILYTRNLIHGS